MLPLADRLSPVGTDQEPLLAAMVRLPEPPSTASMPPVLIAPWFVSEFVLICTAVPETVSPLDTVTLEPDNVSAVELVILPAPLPAVDMELLPAFSVYPAATF